MAGGEYQEKPISLFYSYSHRDEVLRGELEAHLSFLRRRKLIAEWHDRMIGAGEEWKGQIDRQLAEADIILLLVSADFIASDYCWGEEMTKALARHQLGEARVIPVILRPCRWQKTLLGSLQALPTDGKPVSEWPSHDLAFDQIAAAVERAIADLQQQRRRVGEQGQQQQTPESRAKNSVFISYRREDSAEITGRIYDRLVQRFGKEAVFKDIIPYGVDFRTYIMDVVGKCVLIAVIGDKWLIPDKSGNRRIDEPSDFVRTEIASALQRNIPVLPLLVKNAEMPKESEVPNVLSGMLYRNAIKVRMDPDFHLDMDRLMKSLEQQVGAP